MVYLKTKGTALFAPNAVLLGSFPLLVFKRKAPAAMVRTRALTMSLELFRKLD